MLDFNRRNIPLGLSALLLGASATATAATSTEVADRFVHALQHESYNDAAAMFSREAVADPARVGFTLQRIHEQLDGFSTLRHIAHLPPGQSERVEVPGRSGRIESRQIDQALYVTTAKDGQDVYYGVNLTPGSDSGVLSFSVYFPVTNEVSKQRAQLLTDVILR